MNDAAAASPPALATLVVASCNVLNLALPGRAFYPNLEPYDSAECQRKVDWLGAMLARLNADVVGLQEVWDAAGQVLEDIDDPAVVARATLRSLLMRAAEAAALRAIVVDITQRTRDPLLLLGDMNDGPHAVTSQMIAATQAVAYDRQARDMALFHAWDVQGEPALRRDMAYSHVRQGWPEMLDQIWVSEEFVAGSKFALGDVKRVEVFNDHLRESRERWRSDHGFVRALLRLRFDPSR